MYPQLVCLAVHTYFLVCLLARQYIISEHANNKTEVDLYFPIMSTLQFIFYMGWMKVAEAMLNPFGEDDDDFECNALIDRNITMVLMMVDQGYDRAPDLQRDTFWDEEVEPLYSEETARIPNNPLKGSVSEVKLPDNVHEIKMVPHYDDRDPLIQNSPSLRRRVSVVPVRQTDHRQSRTSVGSIEMLRSFKNKLERSFSRGQLEDLPRKTLSHGNLENLDHGERGKRARSGDSTPVHEKSFSNGAFLDSHEDVNNVFGQSLSADRGDQAKTKEVRKSSSSKDLKGPHDFPHHVLDDVLEENEEEIGKVVRKKSLFDASSAKSRDDSLQEREEGAESEKGAGPEETKGEEKKEVVIPMEEEEENKRENNRSSEFFIGVNDADEHQ